jgi:chromosome segregation ATPase
MGTRKRKPSRVERVQLSAMQDAQRLNEEAKAAMEQIKQKSDQTISELTRRNEEAYGLLENQIRQSQIEQENYKRQLADYLNQLTDLRTRYSTLLSERGLIEDQMRERERNEAMSQKMMSSLLSALEIGRQKFRAKTRRRRGLIL